MAGRSNHSSSSKTVVGILSEYFFKDSTLDQLSKHCPSASFIKIEPADVSSERLKDLEILITDPSFICKWLYQLPKLKWMQCTFAGVEPIIEQVPKNMPPPSYVLTRLGGVLGTAMAEYVVGHIIAREKKFALATKYQDCNEWACYKEFCYRELSQLTIGILGFGDIGQHVAKYCKSMNMSVYSIHRTVPSTRYAYVDECFSVEDLSKCLKQCDYLCNLLPSTPSTVGLLGGDVLENCKAKKTVLINIGRGDVITNDSILKALNNQWIGGAILDVFEQEPLLKESALWSHPEVTITPHISGLTTSSQVMKVFLSNYELYEAGKPMQYIVDWSKGY